MAERPPDRHEAGPARDPEAQGREPREPVPPREPLPPTGEPGRPWYGGGGGVGIIVAVIVAIIVIIILAVAGGDDEDEEELEGDEVGLVAHDGESAPGGGGIPARVSGEELGLSA